MRSRLVALALVWGCFGTGVLLACGGDDSSSSSGGTPDASADNNTPNNDTDSSTNPTVPTIVAADQTVYTGMTPVLDGSGTVAQTFVWTVKTAPNGSTVTTATLAGASTARPSFRADVSGDYVLELTASNGAASAKKDVTVKAVPAPLFYMQSNFAEKPPYFEYRVVGTDSTGGHPVACRVNGDPDGGGGDLLIQTMVLADMGQDWWESPNAADPSRVAFVNFDRADASSGDDLVASLALGTNASTCQNPPVKVQPIGGDAGNTGISVLQPRFNRAGSRVAFVEVRDDVWFILTVAYDGKDRRQIGQMCEGPDGNSCSEPSLFPARPQWLNDTTVGWARKQNIDAGDGWEVVTASDSANPNPQVYMTCDGLSPRSILFLKDGSVLANRQAPDAGSKEDLWILKPNAATKKCDVVRNLTNLPQNWSYARDFSVSPDEAEVAFVRFIQDGGTLPEGGGSRVGGEVYIAPLSGTTPPVPAGGTPQKALFGPRYVAGATSLAYNGSVEHDGGKGAAEDAGATFLDGGLPVIAVLPRDGGPVTFAAKSDLDAGSYVFGGGNGGACDFRLDLCSMGALSSRGNGPLFFIGAAAALMLRRRRRRG